MGLRNLLGCSLVVLLISCTDAHSRQRRQDTFYQPPLLLNAAPPPPVAPQPNSYQPPIFKPAEYRSPMEYSSGGYSNQPQSVQYSPPQQHGGYVHQPLESLQYVPLHDSSHSISVHQQPSSAERTSKVVGSSASVQTIARAPASEIEAKKESVAKEKDAAKDEYVVYYYYYYDNDTAAANSSGNFDDIPSLESYDDSKEKTPVGNSLDESRNASASQARSVSSSANDAAFIRADKPMTAQPLKPVSNVFRYGGNEVPRFPVLPNFVVSEVPTTTPDSNPTLLTTSESPTVPPAFNLPKEVEDDEVNSVLDNDPKEKAASTEEETTAPATTTEEPTTTEMDTTTTTTERPSRRRPSLGGSRRRFSPNPASPTQASSNRGRSPPPRSTSTTSATPTSSTATPTRRSFQGSNRLRPRAGFGGSRTRTTEEGEDSNRVRSTTDSTTTSTTTARSRFSSAAPARRFQSSRSRSQSSSSTSSTSTTTRSPSPARSRPTTRPRPNLISRNRPPRPGFLRPKAEEAETTTPAEVEETSPTNEAVASSTTEPEDSEEETSEEEDEEEEEVATTTESNRFSALFRPRNRNALGGNRPRPVIGNRPSRS